MAHAEGGAVEGFALVGFADERAGLLVGADQLV